MNIKPIGQNVFIKEIQQTTFQGTIIIDPATRHKLMYGKVIACGDGKKIKCGLRPMELKPGDEVLFARHSRNVWDMPDGEYLTVREDDIIGVID